MIIKVLGSGCSNCRRLLANTKDAVAKLAIEAEVLYIIDMMEIANAGLMRTPGLIIDGKVVSYGRVPDTNEIVAMIKKIKELL